MNCYRWVQLSEDECQKYEESSDDDFDRSQGYKFIKDGLTYYEFHIDDHEDFPALFSSGDSFGGNLSVRMPSGQKPIIIFGQDETAFNQYSFNTKQWVTPEGHRSILPKNNGYGMMVSSFCSREFGYGFVLSPNDLNEINKKRQRNVKSSHYVDTTAAKNVFGMTKKATIEIFTIC